MVALGTRAPKGLPGGSQERLRRGAPDRGLVGGQGSPAGGSKACPSPQSQWQPCLAAKQTRGRPQTLDCRPSGAQGPKSTGSRLAVPAAGASVGGWNSEAGWPLGTGRPGNCGFQTHFQEPWGPYSLA